MKGVVFTEFLEMVETKFGLETVNEIIEQSELKSEGIYTSIGTYDFSEMQSLIGSLSTHTSIPVDDLIYVYGEYFFNYLISTHPKIFEHYKSPAHFLKSVEGHIHVQVRKIYPDAELPTFEVSEVTDNIMEMTYSSPRALYKFAEALIVKTFAFYKHKITISFNKLKKDGTLVKFTITHNGKQ
ncbi:heme NO-binding domain-containing protein [Reichenbachiella sp. MALMAid0571]|uniref:heme NO-binding domain-containing protein n=1 Tax=Reichenbachiella sp. MALMAid0571 TaxID=3143939 RepID=UPI0032DF9D1D